MSIALKRTSTGWSYRGLSIVKHKWLLPVCCTSYRVVTPGGKAILDAETLEEIREWLEVWEQDGWDSSVSEATDRPIGI